MWTTWFVNAICDGNEFYDDLFGDTAVYLDIEDVAQSLGTDCNVQSISAIFGFTNANDFADLVLHVANVQQPSYGVIIACEKSVGIYIQTNGLCALIDSRAQEQWCHHSGGRLSKQAYQCLLKYTTWAEFSF